MSEPEPIKDKEDYFITRLAQSFNIRNKISYDKFKGCFSIEENRNVLDMFFRENDSALQVFVVQSAAEACQLFIDVPHPDKFKKKGLVALKLCEEGLTAQNVAKEVIFLEMTKSVLDHLYMTYNEILSPILQNPLNQQGWTDLVTKDLMEKFNSYVAQVYVLIGQIKGRTMLPLPSHKLTSSDTTPDKDKAHVFESSIITWTKQIRNVLKLDPEQALKQGNNPGPLKEIEFWENKAANLNSIKGQLESVEVKNILRFLEGNKSTYTNPFSKLQKEVQKFRNEANDNYKFLQLLRDPFQRLSEPGQDFTTLHELFIPIMHTILLIWKNSRHYNTPPRLVVLIREICNAIITKAQDHVNGHMIFQLISAEETLEACEKLQITIDVCTKFKDAYFEYKAKAEGQWKLTTNALFVRLDSFLERCHDILHLTNTIVQFNKLAKIDLGGTKGKTLTESVNQIFVEFQRAVENFQQVKYDIMDINEKNFDDNFYEFRSKIKELERRLASVITQGFDDYDTLYGRFKLLDSFEGLLTRPIIQDELEKKHIVLLEMYKSDLKTVQSIFLEGKILVDKQDDRAPIFNNMPPIAGALTWCKGLRDRILEPIEKLASLGQGITEREEYKDVQKLFQSITKSIKDYEETKILSWEKEVESSSQEKLKQPLLYKDENGLLKVNFDPALVRLLREVKYFQLLELQTPETAKNIYAKSDTFREQIVSLEMIVESHNFIMTCLHPMEEPLIKSRIDKMDEVMKPGIEEFKWKSPNISEFIEKAKITVDELHQIVMKMKEALGKINQSLEKFNTKMIDRKNRPISPDDYDLHMKGIFGVKHQIVKENGTTIVKLVKEVFDQVKVDKKSPAWLNYQCYLNSIVIEGVARAIITALTHLNDQINPVYIKKHDVGQLFDIKLELARGAGIAYDPEIEEMPQGNTVRNTIRSWVNEVYFVAGQFQRLDSSTAIGDYLPEIRDFFEIREIIGQINGNLEWIEEEARKFKEKYETYSYLWTIDPKDSFEEFLNTNEPKDNNEEEESQANNQLLQGCRAKIPNLDLFDEKITSLKSIQSDIMKILTPAEIAWLKINLLPLKTALENKVTSWIQVYTQFLVVQFKTTLKNLKNFIAKTNLGIQNNPADPDNKDNQELLMKVMRVISDVKDVEPKCEGIVIRMKEMVNKLKKHGVQIMEKGEEDPLQSIDNAFTKFNETTQKVFKIKADILPLQTQETISIKKRLDQFNGKVSEFRQEILQNLPYTYEESQNNEDINYSYVKIDTYYKKLKAIEQEATDYNQLERLFELEKSAYKQLRECSIDLKSLKIMWDAIAMVNFQYNDWKGKPFRQIKADFLLESNKVLGNQIKNLPKEVKYFKGCTSVVEKVKNMSVVLPLVSDLHSEFMEDRHWKQVKELTGKQFDHKSLQFTFEDILGLHLHKYENQIKEIVDVAGKEAKIEKKLKAIEQLWNKQIFEFEDYKETKVFLPLENMMEMLDQHSLDLMGMKGQGKYVEFFYSTVEEWREKLSRVDGVVNEWLKVQKNWKILVNIFLASEDIRTQLPEDTKVFELVDKEFREMMIEVCVNPAVVEACIPERKDQLVIMSNSIKRCEKALNDYLEQKKKAFPRFYFLSNQSLLTILSNGQNPPKVAEFLGDCFDGMKTLIFDPPKNPAIDIAKTANGMLSKDDERVPFNSKFECTGAVEAWLSALEYKMRECLEDILENAKSTAELWDSGDKPREDWVRDYNAQIALLTTQIVWTEDVARAFEDLAGGAETAMKECHRLIEFRIANLIQKVRGNLDYLERCKVINIITIDVHSRDVVEKFVLQKIQEAESFAWLSQLKFYWDNKDNDMASRQMLRFKWEKEKDKYKCIIKIVDWFRFYSYEYVGNAIRLVITPLTDRCYITLTQALNLTMGGAPAGPAGTGKTETTKDLGRAVGLPVMVFNCSDQMNKDSMAQIFMGLSQSGAWGCFDEFNRISIEVLSVISTQVKTVLDALKEKKQKFLFMEEGELSLQDTVGFFITMNPGYAGRTELPENLKALFRSCAMVVPDLVLICENMLMSEGFQQARQLSRKFVSLYMLSRELLSKARHYDWGLRAVKSVLRQAGKLKRADPQIAEDPLLMRALRDFNMPKIVTDDKPIFIRLIGDLFPKIECESKPDADFKRMVTLTVKQDMGLVAEELFVLKVVSLAEILEVRHCCFIIGPPGCGKTSVWKTLGKTHINKGEECEYDTLNPKAVTSDELFGCYSKQKEWKNGVLSMIMKNQNKCEEKYKQTHKHKWSILDGDIDPEWIESLNTVMDDNKVLTLVSNDRIPLTPSMRLLLEISNLKNATPATVSRGGVLFINEADIGWMPFMNSWLERSFEKSTLKKEGLQGNIPLSPVIDEIGKSVFYRCFQSYFETNQDIRDRTKVRLIVPMVDIAQVFTICSILDAMMIEHEGILKKSDAKDAKDVKEDDLRLIYEAFFIFAGMWAIGGCFGGGQDDEKDMKDFSSLWKSIAKVKFPEQGLCYDYFWDPVELKWQNWTTKVQTYIPSEEAIFSKIYVSTVHTTRLRTLLDYHLKRRKPVLFVGSAGTGKSAVIKDYLATTKPDQVAYKTINFSSFTDSLSLQKNIESMVEKKSGKTFGSATGKVLICFIDDLNMPYVDKYGTQQPIQLLRQVVDYGSIFNRDQLEERKFLQDLLLFSCLNQKSGSFTVDLRLQRNFSAFTMYTPNQDIIKTIFGSILGAHLAAFDDKISKMSDKLIDATIHVFQKVLRDTRFSPSASKFHYQFNYRELAKVVEGLMRSTPNQFRAQPTKILRLWVHENKRVFEDRFINQEDIKVFRDFLKDALVKNFGDIDEKDNPLEETIFTSFVSVHQGTEFSYVNQDIVSLRQVLKEKLQDYNDQKAQMNLVLFQQAIEHVCRIARILELPGGNSLLVGVGGSGKQSLTRLSTFIVGFDIDQMIVIQNFGVTDLRNFLSEVYKRIAKPNAQPRVFMITDAQIKEEAFLIPINDMLNSGWIFDLFSKEDYENMIQGLRNEAKGNGVSDNMESLATYFLDKMKKNLKVVLCFSPVGDTMRVRSRKFPGIINNTSVDWFHPWPKDALIDVSYRFMTDIELPLEEIRTNISLHMAEVHLSIDVANQKFLKLERRNNYTTPKSFLELIDFYKSLLKEKRENISRQIQRYQQGLNILAETESKVKGLQDELRIKMVDVSKKQADTNVLIDKVGSESAAAEVEQKIANEEEEKTNIASNEAEKLKGECDIALSKALPALEQAKEAVNCLKKPNITEMKSLGSPPGGVLLTARVVMILLGEKITLNDPDDKVWKKATGIMNNPAQFLQRITDFNGEQIDPAALGPARIVCDDPQKNFNEKYMLSQNYAAAKLCGWAVNIVTFNRIFKEVKPLVDAQNKAAETVEVKKKELAIVKERVRILNEKVNTLKRQLEEAETVKQRVEADANACSEKLNAAEKLVKGLAGENKRWGENVKDLSANIKSVIGNALLAAAFVSYIGAFSARLRLELWKTIWLVDLKNRHIPITDDIDPLKILTTEAKKAAWKNEGLPSDQMSMENAAVISACSRWPLIVDPQLQGSTWIRGSQGENLVTISVSQNRWMSQLIAAIPMGKSVLLEGIQQEIDATLDPLLSRAIIKKGRQQYLEMAGEQIEYDSKFKLFLMTKLYNPHFRPEIAAQCTIINFIVTELGLEEQLLAAVVNIEKNELEMQRQELVKKQNDFSVKLDQLEESLLISLSEADPATILDNRDLIATLDNTKKTSTEIEEQSKQAKITEVEINQSREIYRTVANEGALLYFLVIQLSIMEHMYQYSLESFNKFFFKAIEKTMVRDETRIDELRKNIRFTIYQWVARGLFEKHKIIFLALITFRLMQKKVIEVTYELAEMDFLIKCVPRPGTENNLDWLPNTAWDAVQGLIQLEEFRNFATNMEKDAPNRFKDWYNDLAPEEVKLPLDWKKLDSMPFKKLLVLRCLRPDRITVAMTGFIRGALPQGESFVEMDSKLNFSDVLASAVEDSDSTIPIFFILSPGADPVKEVEKLTKVYKIELGKTFHNISLGQGQDEIARRRIEEGNKEGHWVMLQNIHLMPTWLLELEKILDSFTGEAGGGNPKFRLFLSAEPSSGIPIGILDRSIKLTNEPPAGLRANMKRAWSYFSKDEIEDKDPKIKSILFGLCFFHSTVIERRRFGPKGWNMMYPFSMGDLRDSYLVMNRYMEQNAGGKVPFDDLKYIFGEIMYGGHIVDDWDRRLCMGYLDNVMHEGIFDELELFPFIEGKNLSFKVPAANNYEKYIEHIEQVLTQETPLAYGLHSNAEIGFRTTQCNSLFATLLELQPKDSAADEGAAGLRTKNEIAQDMFKLIMEDMGMKQLVFNIDEIKNKMDAESKGPYQNVFLQEIEYMNYLLQEIVRSLEEIDQGFRGILTISEMMEQIIDSISLNRVPVTWVNLAYPSKRGLASWLTNLFKRIEQLNQFRDDPYNIPKVVMVGRFFNPQSFLTAIKQVVGRLRGQELNRLFIQTDVTKKSIEEIDQTAKDGAYVFGFVLEGARWDLTTSQLEESRPKEMFSVLPVVYCRALQMQQEGKEDKSLYQCPCYRTEDRGNTYIFTGQLKTRYNPRKWILAGVGLLLDVEGVSDEAAAVKKEKK